MLILKHVRNWSYEVLEREVRANVVYRTFCRIGTEKVPDEKTLVRLGQAIGPDTIAELHDRIVSLAQQRRVIHGRKMRVDTTVVESNIHYPTDSGLLNDGARVLTRMMQQMEGKVGNGKRKVRNRMRTVSKRVIAIAHALRQKGAEGELKRTKEYRQLLQVTRQILNDSRRVLQEVKALPPRRRRKVRQLSERLETMAERVRRVVRQTQARVFEGVTQFPGKLLSLFEPHTEIIRKGKAGKPNEFGKLVQLQEAENQIITHYEVYEERPSDRHLLLPAVEAHQRKLGRTPRLLAADAGYYSRANEEVAQAVGVRYVSVPNRSTRSAERRQWEKQRWFSESFSQLVLRFTDGTFDEIKKSGKAASPSCDASLLRDSQHVTRKKLHYNLDARILQDVLSPETGGLFVAFVHGKKYNDKILFMIDPHGAHWVQPEEVELMTYDENKEGIWTAFHYSSEYADGTAKGSQKNGVVHIDHQQLDTEIGKTGHLNGKAQTEMIALTNGVRVVPFMLYPTLRVQNVTGGDGQTLNFVQEEKLDDPQYWVVLSKPLAKGEKYTITTTYGGKDAVSAEGVGNYFPIAREDWYPNSAYGLFGEYTNYELTFRIPKGMKMAATGDLVSEKNDGDRNVSLWKSPVPLTVAGFNFGKFKLEQAKLDKPDMQVLSYANEEPPDWVKNVQHAVSNEDMLNAPHQASDLGSSLGNMSTVVLNKKALGEGEISLRIYSDFFGPIPYKRLEIMQQTATNFGQSWPGLVYLPMSYLFDTTTRHSLGNIMRTMYPTYTDDPYGYFSVVAPHEVAHQWWGHTIGFNSYRDQWMSEGFADMSASIYLQMVYAKEPQKYIKFWNDERKMLLDRNKEGFRAIDAGPVTMGYRVSNSKEGFDSGRHLIYPKGAYILHMIRQMMWERQGGDQRFKDTMHDFVSTYGGSAATTEDFKATVEKHMSPQMDLQGNHKMDWFFNEYVYGTALPSYKFDYTFGKAASGDVTVSVKLTQSDVNQNFAMPVPIYLELANGSIARLGSARLVGNNTVNQMITLTGLKDQPKRAMINYYDDVLAAN